MKDIITTKKPVKMTGNVLLNEVDIKRKTPAKKMRPLDLSCLDRSDYLNLILQRSEVMFDIPKYGQIIKSWQRGDVEPINAVVDQMGEVIAQRTAEVIYEEYLEIEGLLKTLKPRRIADIGCGYAFFDLFAAKALKSKIVLIDLEENEHRHFGYKDVGAAYSSLAVAKQLLVDNKVPALSIECVNPRHQALEDIAPVDLIVSFLSCGFHYPVDSYLPMIDKTLAPGGAAIFDLREKSADDQSAKLAQFGIVTTVMMRPKVRRVMLTKSKQ